MKKILITGASGLIGGILKQHLEEVGGYKLTALNRSEVQGIDCHRADITDLESIKPAFNEQDVVVHLSAKLAHETWESMAQTNLIGIYNVYEAARLSGVSRIVFASSGAAIRGFDYLEPYKTLAEGNLAKMPNTWEAITVEQAWPKDIYGATKIWGELLGRVFSDAHGLSVICLRLGSVTPENKPSSIRDYPAYFSHHDVATLLKAALDAPDELKYGIFFGTSDNKWGYRDLSHTHKMLGWKPQDSAEHFGKHPS